MRRKFEIEQTVLEEADILIEKRFTIRELAKIRKVSKTGLHSRLNRILPEIDYNKYLKVREILDKNKSERHIRGGISTKNRWIAEKSKI